MRVHRVVAFNRPEPSQEVPLPPEAKVLPIEARERLIAASRHLPRSQRVTAINKAIVIVRKNHPQFFQKEI